MKYLIRDSAPKSWATKSRRRPLKSTRDGYSTWLTILKQRSTKRQNLRNLAFAISKKARQRIKAYWLTNHIKFNSFRFWNHYLSALISQSKTKFSSPDHSSSAIHAKWLFFFFSNAVYTFSWKKKLNRETNKPLSPSCGQHSAKRIQAEQKMHSTASWFQDRKNHISEKWKPNSKTY